MDLIYSRDGFAAQLFEDMVNMNKSYRRVFLGITDEELKRSKTENAGKEKTDGSGMGERVE